MSTIADLVVKLGADISEFQSAMQRAQHSSDLLLGGVLALSAGILTFGVNAVKAAGEMEQTTVAFTTMLKSADKAETLLSELKVFAQTTPFEFNEIAQASKKLLAFGVNAEDIEKTLRRLGDVSSGIGAPISEIAELYGKAKVQGRLFGEDINQLTNRGIPIIKELAKQFGVTESEVKNLVESGDVGFEQLEQAFIDLTGEGSQFGGLMEEQAKTLPGLWSNFMDAVSQATVTVGEELIDAFNIKELLGDAGTAVGDFAKLLDEKGLAETLDEIFGEDVEMAIYAIAAAITTSLIPAFIGLASKIGLALLPLTPFLVAGLAVGVITYTIINAPEKDIGAGVATAAGVHPGGQTGWGDKLDISAGNWGNNKYAGLVQFIDEHAPLGISRLIEIGETAAIYLPMVEQSFSDMSAGIQDAWADISRDFNAAVTFIDTALDGMCETTSGWGTFIIDTLESVRQAWIDFWNLITGGNYQITGFAGFGLGESAIGMIDTSKIVDGAVLGIEDNRGKFTTSLSSMTEAGKQSILDGWEMKSPSAFMQRVAENLMTTLSDGISGNTVSENIATSFYSTKDSILSVFNGLGGELNTVFAGAAAMIFATWGVVTPYFIVAVAGHIAAFDGISEKILARFVVLMAFFNSLPETTRQLGIDMMLRLIEGIQGQEADTLGAVASLVDKIKAKFLEGFGIHSPSDFMIYIAQNLAGTLIDQLEGSNLISFVDNFVAQIKAAFDAGNFSIDYALNFLGDDAATVLSKMGISVATLANLLWPVLEKSITSYFGYRSAEETNGIGSTYHEGIDIGAAYGDSVWAAGAGTITLAGDYGGYGNAVMIDHGGGMETLYAHLSEILVQVGQIVKAGQEIGLVGSTGNSTGAHLHFGVYQNGEAIDPMTAQLANTATAGYSGDVIDWLTQAMAITGQTGAENLNHLYEIAMNESGGDPFAFNDWDSNYYAGTPSMGLMQTIEPTFDAYKIPGYDDIWNPIHNAIAAINYMIARYGSILNTGTHGYALGTDYVPETGHYLIHRGEAVITADDNASSKKLLQSILGALDRIASRSGNIYIDKNKTIGVIDSGLGRTYAGKGRWHA